MPLPSHPDLDRLQLAELLDFRPDLGVIRLHEQRVVILSAAAMGLLRKELIDTLGPDIARRLLLRFGYADGYHDAVNLRERFRWSDPLEGLGAGTMLHTLEGIVRSEIVRLERGEDDRFDAEFVWQDSYEAEQHVARTRVPVGDTLDLKAHERRLIGRALERYDGNRRRAAEALNISSVTLWRKMKEYGFPLVQSAARAGG